MLLRTARRLASSSLLSSSSRRGTRGITFAAAAGGAVVAGCAVAGLSIAEPAQLPASQALPTFSKADVEKHSSPETGVWVTFDGRVYDITSFIENHPGGVEKIMTAAGGSIEPYWSLYRQHVKPGHSSPTPKDHVAEILAPLQVGWLDPAEVAAAKAQRKDDDPYVNEPERHPALKLISETPCSGESPSQLMADSWTTANELFFVRNHHPVPPLNAANFTLEVSGPPQAGRKTYTLQQLRDMPRTTVTASLQCGGNRRADLNTVRKTSGNAWGCGAFSNAAWTGVRLRDVLVDAGVVGEAVAHVQFEGEDGTKASIPIDKAVSPTGDVLLAYEMNGEPLPADHGYPLRAVVPGYVGVRNIKWIRKVIASHEEAQGVWQRGIAYKAFGPDVTSVDGLDISKYAPINEMPVQSAILMPRPDTTAEAGETVEVRGYAWSGGGRGIVRVDVSADDGATWHTAKLEEGSEQPLHRAWAWTFWRAEVPVASGEGGRSETRIVCKAVDAAHNTQPESPASVWNLRGLANNSWHRVPIRIVQDSG